MNFNEFEQLVSTARLTPYHRVTGGDRRKVKNLYRLNVQLSSELFTIIAYFEVALRNAIHNHYTQKFTPDWIRDSIQPNGIFLGTQFGETPKLIEIAYKRFTDSSGNELPRYSSDKLVAELSLGFWTFLFAGDQFNAGKIEIGNTGKYKTLLEMFNNKPKNIGQKKVFTKLKSVNKIRNRIAHHEPIIFQKNNTIRPTKPELCHHNLF